MRALVPRMAKNDAPARAPPQAKMRGAPCAHAPAVSAPILDEWFGAVGSATSGVPGFRASTLYGWSCVLPA